MESNEIFWKIPGTEEIVDRFGTPVYVYSEAVLRQRCRDLVNMVKYDKFVIDYSMKANSNPALLKIIREEGLEVDVMSPGEIYLAEMAGYKQSEIFFICNNVSPEEMSFAIERNILISVDSLAQLEQYGRLAPGSRVAVRINPGTGAGHHEKVVTAGKNTKFGINIECLTEVKELLNRYQLKLVGINQHIGSLFLQGEEYLKSAGSLFDFALAFPDLEFVDLGGGFGIPYHKNEGERRLNLEQLGSALDSIINEFVGKYGREIYFRAEPGRYIVAECGALLGKVFSVKYNLEKKYIGTDVGFNVLMRPVLYDSYHEIEIYRQGQLVDSENGREEVTVVGNICETGDILAKSRLLPVISEGDIIAIRDAGAYGHVMSSNYNSRLRPSEILIQENGEIKEIRKRDSYEDIIKNYQL